MRITKAFEQLRAPLMTDSKRRARIEEYRRVIREALAYVEPRESKRVSQEQPRLVALLERESTRE